MQSEKLQGSGRMTNEVCTKLNEIILEEDCVFAQLRRLPTGTQRLVCAPQRHVQPQTGDGHAILVNRFHVDARLCASMGLAGCQCYSKPSKCRHSYQAPMYCSECDWVIRHASRR